MSIQHIVPPDQLLGIDQAAELLFNTIANQGTIIIVGDYDADGATSTAIRIRLAGSPQRKNSLDANCLLS